MGCPLAENITLLLLPILIHEIIVIKSLAVMEMRAKKNVLRNHVTLSLAVHGIPIARLLWYLIEILLLKS